MRISILLAISLLVSCNQPVETASPIPSSEWALLGFEKLDSLNPIISPASELSFDCPVSGKTVFWEERNVLNPSAIVKDDKVYLFYRAQDKDGTSRIGMAVSNDGLNFTKSPQPVFYPDHDSMKIYEWNYRKAYEDPDSEECYFCYFDGVEDPRIVESEDRTYIMTYTSYDGKTARLSVASSTNLENWTKHGLVLKDSIYKDHWSKAGAILARREGNKILATRINGKYWMYFGDTHIFMASSDDLVDWAPSINEESRKLISVMHPRMGYFDSRLVEPGPYALLREEGILFIYNGSNAANFNDPELPRFTYAAGQALFDKEVPHKLIDRLDSHFIHPDKDYERVGEVNEVCFVEGLVYFKDKWFLYYGTADRQIAVAVKE